MTNNGGSNKEKDKEILLFSFIETNYAFISKYGNVLYPNMVMFYTLSCGIFFIA